MPDPLSVHPVVFAAVFELVPRDDRTPERPSSKGSAAPLPDPDRPLVHRCRRPDHPHRTTSVTGGSASGISAARREPESASTSGSETSP